MDRNQNPCSDHNGLPDADEVSSRGGVTLMFHTDQMLVLAVSFDLLFNVIENSTC